MPADTCLYPHGFITDTYIDVADVANASGYRHNGRTHNDAHSIYYP